MDNDDSLERIPLLGKRSPVPVAKVYGLQAILESIQETYLQDRRPWVIGFSGGKDSTATLQLVWQALRELPEGARRKPIHVISSNTLVETPAIVSYIRNSIAAIERAGRADGLQISGRLVEPLISDSFWVNLLGRGYPAPSNKFRWCTERLKINPADRFIKDQVARYGEVVLALGVRSAESATRAQVMSLHKIEGTRLRTHKKLAGALVFAPIEDWSTNDVWSYLLQNAETPWGSDNNDLAAMYRTADAECPLVVDTTTPSCGNSRFGCWVCTVVSRDKSMEAMVDSGQTWMESLLEIRDELSDTQRLDRRHEVRSARKLNGRVLLKNDGNELALGPYTFAYCKELLARILNTQRELPPEAEGFELISNDELLEIRRVWRSDRHDWEDSLPRIYESCTGNRWFAVSDASADAEEDAGIVDRTALEYEVPALLMRKLIDAERQTFGLRRRSNIYKNSKRCPRPRLAGRGHAARRSRGDGRIGMFLRSLALRNYGIFKDAQFDLTTDVDHPIVLVSGNNGAGKTSILEALRVALHGRRAFDAPLGEAEYLRNMANRFHMADKTVDASIRLEFDYVDLHKTRNVKVARSWGSHRQNVAESLSVKLDGKPMLVEDADDLLCSIVPPEIARYFFFDGERIRELAEWEVEDESALFAAVGDLLGLGVLNQLRADLIRLASMQQKEQRTTKDTAVVLEDAEKRAQGTAAALRAAKTQTRKVRGALDRARAEVRRVGAMQHDEIAAMENELGKLVAERRSLLEEAQRAATDVLPLLSARTLRKRFAAEMRSRRDIEDREIVTNFFKEKNAKILTTLRDHGLRAAEARSAIESMSKIARGPLVSLSASIPNLSRSEAAWMQRVIEQELPEMAKRTSVIVQRLRSLDERIVFLEDRRKTAPTDDPAGEDALAELERCQRASVEHDLELRRLEEENILAEEALQVARGIAKARRLEVFREGRLQVRERMTTQILDALPVLSERLQESKEHRFARYLEEALRALWHKTDRLQGVDVSFGQRRIALLDGAGEISKPDLSSGEKQLFAVAFIYALARLSGRLMPFVIDTPLGRLDHQHRRRFVAEFLPDVSHQIILLSTDTEIVGSLYEDIRPFIAHHHELADFNGGATSPVEMATA